jgi:hypothetical protein
MSTSKSSSKSGRQRRSPKSASATRQRASGTRRSARSQHGTNELAGHRRGKKPAALAAGAATAVFIGAISLRSRRRQRKHVLGMPLPRSRRDVRSFVKQIGKASNRAGGTSKDVGKEFQRLGDQAEQVGKALS